MTVPQHALAHADLELEVAAAATAEARLSQERTARWLRRVAGVTALLILALSVATLVYVVQAVGEARRAAEAALQASQGNRELLAAFQAGQAAQAKAEEERRRLTEQRLQRALAVVEQRRQDAEARTTAQLQLVLDLLVAEVRNPENQERQATPRLAGSERPHARPTPRPGQ